MWRARSPGLPSAASNKVSLFLDCGRGEFRHETVAPAKPRPGGRVLRILISPAA
jgi:hypothetical protein